MKHGEIKRKDILELCASDPEAVVSYIDSLESKNHKRILELCASDPEIIISYIETLDSLYNSRERLENCMVPRKRPDRSLDLYKRNSDRDFCGYVYNGNKAFNTWSAYAVGYKEAIKKIIKVAKRDKFMYHLKCIDTIGYPIFYLFNQYLELIMKEILRKGNCVIPEEDRNEKVLRSHDLVSLWDECKKILQYMGWCENSDSSEKEKNECRENIATIGYFINQFAQDEQSQAFRYPESKKKGNKEEMPFLVDDHIIRLNVSALSDVFDWLSYRLEGIIYGIDEYGA